jgi:hypothetical protein
VRREVLVHDIGFGIIAGRVEAEQHLPARPAMDVDDRRAPAAAAARAEELAADLDARRRRGRSRLGRSEAARRRRLPSGDGRPPSSTDTRAGDARRDRRHGVASDRRGRSACPRRRGRVRPPAPERARARSAGCRCRRIGRVEKRRPPGPEQEGLDLDRPRVQRPRLAAARRVERVDVEPAAPLPGKRIGRPAPEEVAAARAGIAPALAARRRPERPRTAAREVDVGSTNRVRCPAAAPGGGTSERMKATWRPSGEKTGSSDWPRPGSR